MLNNNKLNHILHGENFLRKVDKLPKGKISKHKLFTVGHSESGHNHVIEAPSKEGIEVVEKDNKRYLLIKEVSKLFHQKAHEIHETVEVQPGIYEVTQKTEYDPFQQIVREVRD